MEILAPVGSLDALKVAVYSGANAVYLGLDQFNARIKAENFNLTNIDSAVKFAHLYGVKVYVTINTLIKDEEIPLVIQYLKELERVNVDAIIVQDLSIPYLMRDNDISIVLHASTQLGINNLQGAKFLELLGFKRVVLARETQLEDIQLIKENTTLEIEYFVHGAICVSYSGACLFSSIKNGNSGNRGLCLQYCRKKFYSAISNKFGYYLSIKDQCLVDNLSILAQNGVDSIKIEGRMKSLEYLKSAVLLYSKALKNEDYKNELISTKIAYNRGDFSKGYIFSKKSDLIFPNIQGNFGYKLGTIIKYQKINNVLYLVVESKIKLNVGDGVKIVFNNRELGGFIIDKIIYKNNNLCLIPTNKEYRLNADIHLTSSKELKDKILDNKKRMPVNISLSGEISSYLKATIRHKDIEINIVTEYLLQEAINKQSFDLIKQQLSKLNETPFYLNKLELNFDKDVFIPNAVLGYVRRTLIDMLEKEMIFQYVSLMDKKTLYCQKFELNSSNIKSRYFISTNLSDIYRIQDINSSKFIYYIEDYNKIDYENLDKVLKIMPIYVKFPLINTTKENNKIIEFLKKYKEIGLFANSISQLYIAYSLNIKVILGEKLNILNKYFVQANNINEYINSIEMKYDLATEGIILALKRVELMHFAHCPLIASLGVDCLNCKYSGEFIYTNHGEDFIIDRNKIDLCQFILFDNTPGSLLNKEGIYKRNIMLDFTKIDNLLIEDIIKAVGNGQKYNSNQLNNKLMLGVN